MGQGLTPRAKCLSFPLLHVGGCRGEQGHPNGCWLLLVDAEQVDAEHETPITPKNTMGTPSLLRTPHRSRESPFPSGEAPTQVSKLLRPSTGQAGAGGGAGSALGRRGRAPAWG